MNRTPKTPNHSLGAALALGAVLAAHALCWTVLLTGEARPHSAPSGWAYPLECCSNQDCREVADADVFEGPDGYRLVASGEVVPYADARVKDSPDGRFHWCSTGGSDTGRTICLFVPPRGF